jgi:hypothetical protein
MFYPTCNFFSSIEFGLPQRFIYLFCFVKLKFDEDLKDTWTSRREDRRRSPVKSRPGVRQRRRVKQTRR